MGDIRTIIRHFCIVLAVLLPGAIAESPEQLFFNYKPPHSNEKYRFRIVRELDEYKSVNLTIYFQEQRTLMFDSERILFYGKDIDNDGLVETFFYRDRFIIRQINKFYQNQVNKYDQNLISKDDLYGTRMLVEILNHEFKIKNRSIVALGIIGLGKTITFAISNSENAGEEYVNTQVQLYELRERADRLPESEDKTKLLELFEKGWAANNNKFEEETDASTYFTYGAGDLAVAGATIKIFQWVGKGGKWLIKKTANTAVGKSIGTGITKAAEKTKNVLIPVWAQATLSQFAFQNLKKSIKAEIDHLIVQSRFAKMIISQFSKEASTVGKYGSLKIFEAYKNGLSDITYLSLTQLTQVIAEGINRGDEIYDPNPIILAENLFEDKDFLQNFLYMTNETTVLSGILRTDATLSRRFKIAGTVALINSTTMNFLIKDEVEPSRVVLDTGWELGVGIAQTYFDISMIEKFKKHKNKKLRLVGYVIALVDQGVGYYAYSNATEKLNEHNKEQKTEEAIKLIPVMAPLP